MLFQAKSAADPRTYPKQREIRPDKLFDSHEPCCPYYLSCPEPLRFFNLQKGRFNFGTVLPLPPTPRVSRFRLLQDVFEKKNNKTKQNNKTCSLTVLGKLKSFVLWTSEGNQSISVTFHCNHRSSLAHCLILSSWGPPLPV